MNAEISESEDVGNMSAKMMVTTAVSGRHAVPVDEPAEPEVPERARRRVFSAQYKLT